MPIAAVVAFLSAGAVLVLEIVGLRVVAPYVGVTLETSSAVIGVSLGAIACGAWVGGWLADRVDPRRLLPPAFLLAAAVTAVTLPIVRCCGEALRGEGTIATLSLPAMAVLLPAALLSSVAPLLVKLQLQEVGSTGRVVGALSSIGTLGGITASLATGFVVVAALPSSIILLGLAGLLATTGVVLGWYLHRSRAPSATPSRWIDRWFWARAGIGAAPVLLGAKLAAGAPNPCDIETAYYCAQLSANTTRPAERVLVLNGGRHSQVDLMDPRRLGFRYTQWLGAVVDTVAAPDAPLRVLHLGGGGFTMPRYVSVTRPGSWNRVLEVDPRLVAFNQDELALTPGPELSIAVGDARVLARQEPEGSFDLVIGDAFGDAAVPWHLTTVEFVAEVRRTLRESGVYALNVIDEPTHRFIRAELATVMDVFQHVAMVRARDGGTNFVIVASDAPLGVERLSAAPALAGPAVVLSGPPLTRFVGDARRLTDDFAPVDQLMQTQSIASTN